MSAVKELLIDEIERLDEDNIHKALQFIQNLKEEKSLERLKAHPAIKVPSSFPSGFRPVKPVLAKGISASRLLTRERR